MTRDVPYHRIVLRISSHHHLHSSSLPHPVPLSAPAVLRFSCIHFFHLPGCYSYVICFTTRSFLFSKGSFLPARPHTRSSTLPPNCRFEVYFNRPISEGLHPLSSRPTHSFPLGSTQLSPILSPLPILHSPFYFFSLLFVVCPIRPSP